METDSFTGSRNRYGHGPVVDTQRMLPLVALLTAVLLWGGSFAAMRLGVQAMHPLSVVWLRMIIALASSCPLPVG